MFCKTRRSKHVWSAILATTDGQHLIEWGLNWFSGTSIWYITQTFQKLDHTIASHVYGALRSANLPKMICGHLTSVKQLLCGKVKIAEYWHGSFGAEELMWPSKDSSYSSNNPFTERNHGSTAKRFSSSQKIISSAFQSHRKQDANQEPNILVANLTGQVLKSLTNTASVPLGNWNLQIISLCVSGNHLLIDKRFHLAKDGNSKTESEEKETVQSLPHSLQLSCSPHPHHPLSIACGMETTWLTKPK